MAAITLAAASPALIPFTSITATSDLTSLPLRLPALALGVAIAAVDPLVIERWRAGRARDSSLALLAGAGFGAATLVVAIIAATTSSPTCGASARLACCGLLVAAEESVCGATLFIIVFALLEAWLGYVIGAFVARASYWWILPPPATRSRLWLL